MRRIAHLSDLHFGRAGAAMVDALRRDLDQLAPDLVAISGDLTQRARPHEFAAARDFVRSLPGTVICAPGNHDIPLNPLLRFLDPRRRFREYILPHCRAYHVDDEIAVAAIDTTSRARFSFDWSGGRIKRDDIAGVLRWMRAETCDHFTVVVAHHVLKTLVERESGGHRLRRRALGELADAGVDLVLGGHHHRADAQIFAPGANAPDILVVHCSTTTSERVRGEPNAYNLLELDGDRVLCRVRAAAREGFAEIKATGFRRVPAPQQAGSPAGAPARWAAE
jgi:3',5'-cyclic AMP phosphodiesterase CpdA